MNRKSRYWVDQYAYVLFIVFMLHIYVTVTIFYDYAIRRGSKRGSSSGTKKGISSYKYLLVNRTEVIMEYGDGMNSYKWFVSMKDVFMNLGEEENVIYPQDYQICDFTESPSGSIGVNKTKLKLCWVEKQHPDVKLGGFYAPAQCRAACRVAIVVPYRGLKGNLGIFLHHLHRFLKKQMLEYRIFVIEQYGTGEWNKGTLNNIAFLETQRFGDWDCLIFHDMDLIPDDERILYYCSSFYPIQLSVTVNNVMSIRTYPMIFDGVTAFTPSLYNLINGYSNFYGVWNAEDYDMATRLRVNHINVSRYNPSVGRYVSLTNNHNKLALNRSFLYRLSLITKQHYRIEGLRTTKYKLISVTKKRLYTHILADVNPDKITIDFKTLMRHIVSFGNTKIQTSRERKHVTQEL